MTLSVILPVYNGERTLESTVRSVLDQRFRDLELIIADDGSDDGTPEICRRLVASDNRVKVLTLPHGGVSSARNAGIDAASGEFITFIDADDTLDKFAYETAVKEIKSREADLLLYGFTKVMPYGTSEQVLPENAPPRQEDYLKRLILSDGLFNPVWNKIYRAELIRKKKIRFPVHIKVGEDAIFNINFAFFAKRLAVIPISLYYYVIDGMSAMGRTANHDLRMQARLYRCEVLSQLGCKEQWIAQLAEGCFKNQIRDLGILRAIGEFNNICRGNIVKNIHSKDIRKNPFSNCLLYAIIKIGAYPLLTAIPYYCNLRKKRQGK